MEAINQEIVEAVADKMADGKAVQIDSIIKDVMASHGELTRREITERIVQVVLSKGAAAIWAEAERPAPKPDELTVSFL